MGEEAYASPELIGQIRTRRSRITKPLSGKGFTKNIMDTLTGLQEASGADRWSNMGGGHMEFFTGSGRLSDSHLHLM
jgi:hypothetical protein